MKHIPKSFFRLLALVPALLLALASPAAFASTNNGVISRIEVNASDATYYGLRVALDGVTTICTGGPDWAYVNEADSNYKTTLSALLFAASMKKTVTIVSALTGAGCKISFVVVAI